MESNHSQELDKLFAALSKAQAEIEGAKENSKNPHFKSSYADLFSVWQACKKPLTDNGLSIIQTMEPMGEKTILVTILGHSSGQWIKSVLPMPIVKYDPQGFGSALTYCRRYALSAMVGISPMDDDAEAEMVRRRKEEEEEKKVAIPAWDQLTESQKQEIEILADGIELNKIKAWANNSNAPFESILKKIRVTHEEKKGKT